MALNVMMMGPPGAGKGTQAQRLAQARRLVKISTGDILREAVHDGTPLGLQAKATMDAGGLVDDATMIGIVRERLKKPDAMQGFILDGFPRTVPQARALDGIMAERAGGPLVVVTIEVPDEDLLQRMTLRRICKACGASPDPTHDGAACAVCGGELVQRTDDNREVVEERLKVYERDTKPLIEYYQGRSTYCAVNGAQAPERVAAELQAAIDRVPSARGGRTANRPQAEGRA